MTSKFDEIRPYDDTDLEPVIARLLENTALINSLTDFRFSRYPRFLRGVFRPFVKRYIRTRAKAFASVADFQKAIEPYMKHMLRQTTDGLTVSGLEALNVDAPCLFVSNHRDIALDPAFVNWALHINGEDTVRIAVGDNLLHTDWVADLIRLNKCFVVKRSTGGRREKLAAAKLLSEYIHHSLQHDKQHIWIAQREGRAKDGIDLTNPAILSMLAMNKPKEATFSEYITSLRIVPVSISYEFDPCDTRKAKERYQSLQQGTYDKPDNEDLNSIIKGFTGKKGRVHVHFGEVINDSFESAKELAKHIDEKILSAYRLFPTSQMALELIENDTQRAKNESSVKEQAKAKQYLQERAQSLNSEEYTLLLEMYANPILRSQKR